MADTITPKSERYVDTPLTNFPVGEDTIDRMSDITSDLMPIVIQYNQYIQSGNITEANNLLRSNPRLMSCFFNAEKWNVLRDAVIAIERFYLEEVDEAIKNAAQNAVGINDSPSPSQKPYVAYSAQKIDSLLDDLGAGLSTRTITVSLGNWSSYSPYTNQIYVSGVRSTDSPVIGLYIPSGTSATEEKKLKRAAGCISYIDTTDNYITVTCIGSKPETTFQLMVKG